MIERDPAQLNVISPVARSEFILGGQKSGKSHRAELLACSWLQQSSAHRAVLLATAQPWDEEMRQRITRHQHDRTKRVPGLQTVEEPLELAQALTLHSQRHTLVAALSARHLDGGRFAIDAERSAMKKFIALWLLCLTALLPAHALQLVDDRGVSVSFVQSPQRIISLLPSLTESICGLDQCQRLVGQIL